MSDLISREAVENITWEEPSYSDPLNVLTEVRDKVRALPSADIMECARALLDYSKGRKCEECCFESACNNGFSCPCDWVLWDFPEGEKE